MKCFLIHSLKGTLSWSGMRSFAHLLCCLSPAHSIVFGWGRLSPQHWASLPSRYLSCWVTHPPLCSHRSNMVWAHQKELPLTLSCKEKPGAGRDSRASISSSLRVPLRNRASGESRRLWFHSVISAHMWGQANYPLLQSPLQWTGWNVGGMLGSQHALWKRSLILKQLMDWLRKDRWEKKLCPWCNSNLKLWSKDKICLQTITSINGCSRISWSWSFACHSVVLIAVADTLEKKSVICVHLYTQISVRYLDDATEYLQWSWW